MPLTGLTGLGGGPFRSGSVKKLVAPQTVFVSDLSSSWNTGAGNSKSFSVTVNDGANPGKPVTIEYQWYRNGSPVNNATSSTFNYYQPVYYSDNGNSIYCRVTLTNEIGSDIANSTTCSINVSRNIHCNEVQRLENINFSGAGGKPGGGTSVWGEYKLPKEQNGVSYTDICGVAWDIDSFKVKARDGRCPGGYELTLQFKIDGGFNYNKEEKQSASNGNWCYFGLGTGWMDVEGNQDSFRFQLIFRAGNAYSQCTDGSQVDIQPEQDNPAIGKVSIRTRTYQYEQRPSLRQKLSSKIRELAQNLIE